MPELEPSVLPVVVTASHLRSCAAELEQAQEVALGELVEVIRRLVTGQRHLSRALASLADRVWEGQHGVLSAAPSAQAAAFGEILQAAASTFGYSADALAESDPLAQAMAHFAGTDTRL